MSAPLLKIDRLWISGLQILVQFVSESPEMTSPMLLTLLHSFKLLVVKVGPIPV